MWSGGLSPEESDEAARTITTHSRPRTRGECADGPRPCPMVGCRYHLGLDVSGHTVRADRANSEHRSILVAMGMRSDPGAALEAMTDTCALDVADRGEHTMEVVGALLDVTRARVQQIEAAALEKLRRRGVMLDRLMDHLDGLPAREAAETDRWDEEE